MNALNTLMQQRGYHSAEDGSLALDTPVCESHYLAPLETFEILEVNGKDGERFLQGQTSQHLTLVDGSLAPLTAFCTPKGRIMGMAQLLRVTPEQLWLLMPTGTAAPLKTHLAKFAPFYKVTLEIPDTLKVIGLSGQDSLTAAARFLESDQPLPTHDFAMLAAGNAVLARQPAQAEPRGVLIAQEAQMIEAMHYLLEAGVTPADGRSWTLGDIRAGLQWVTATQTDSWLPQMLNLEALAAISFKKGCYTGQEVVARAHFRGQVKKRLMRLISHQDMALPSPGTKVLDSNNKSLGAVMTAAHAPDGTLEILAVVSLRDEDAILKLETQQTLAHAALPYSVERRDPERLKD
ncbi:YgfZ/GcvT domain-containing protein [Cobetia crustatorum]|nr:folate-binding protein YgfZ [Cobetia crustatorum]